MVCINISSARTVRFLLKHTVNSAIVVQQPALHTRNITHVKIHFCEETRKATEWAQVKARGLKDMDTMLHKAQEGV